MINVEQIEDILSCQDKAFVTAAYLALLGRHPDRTGFANYLEQVRLGVDKLDLLESMVSSAEGQRVAADWGPALERFREQQGPREPLSLVRRMRSMPSAVQRWIAPRARAFGQRSDALARDATGAAEAEAAGPRASGAADDGPLDGSAAPAWSLRLDAAQRAALSLQAQAIHGRLMSALAPAKTRTRSK